MYIHCVKIDEMPYILSKAVGGLGVPPLPLVSEIASCFAFLLDSLDDAVEDAVKLLLLVTVAYFTFTLVSRWSASTRLAKAAAVAALLCCHPPCDMIADRLGDKMITVQNAIRECVGYEKKIPRPDRGDPVARYGLVATFIDDLVEDSFKSVCIASHTILGGILQTAVISRAAENNIDASIQGGRKMVKLAGYVAAIGTPVSQYQNCNIYSDRLADKVQKWFSIPSEHRSVFSTGTEPREKHGKKRKYYHKKKKYNSKHPENRRSRDHSD